MNGGKYFHDYFNGAARIAGFNVRWKGTEEAFKKTLQKRSPRHISLFKKKKSTKIFVWGSHLRLLRCSKNMTFIF